MPRLQFPFFINVCYIGLKVIVNVHNCKQCQIEQLTELGTNMFPRWMMSDSFFLFFSSF